MGGREPRPDECADRRLSLKRGRQDMTREPIHPGETLREDLEALGMSAAELARRIEVPVNRITQIPERPARRNGRHRAASGSILRDIGGVLAQPAEALRVEARGTRPRRRDRTSAVTREPRAVVRIGLSGNGRRGDLYIHVPESRQRRPATPQPAQVSRRPRRATPWSFRPILTASQSLLNALINNTFMSLNVSQ